MTTLTTARLASAFALIPPRYQHRILQVRGAGDAEFWEIGQVALELEVSADEGERESIRNALADLAGVLPKTIGEYKSCAAYYPPAVRAAYPTLTRWHFRHAKAAGTLSASETWLRRAADSADDYGGSPMPVRALAAQMAEAAGKEKAPTPTWKDAAKIVRASLEDLSARDDLPGGVHTLVMIALNAMRKVV